MTPGLLPVCVFGDIRANPNTQEIRKSDALLDLEPKARRVLFHLIQNRDRVVGKRELIEAIWEGAAVTDNSLTRVIAQLRRELGDNARAPLYIETSATEGYRFIAVLREPESGIAAPAQPPARHSRTWIAGPAVLVVAAAAWWMWSAGRVAPLRLEGMRQITRSSAADLWPTFSPDASQIAYSSNRSGSFEIYVQSLAPGSVERRLTSDGQDNIQPAWSPDGQYLAYVPLRRRRIALIPVSGGAARYLTDSGDSPAWSPDGRQLVYRTRVGELNPALEVTGPTATTLQLVALDGTPPRTLTQRGNPDGGHGYPQWSADGRHVLFSLTMWTPSRALWTVDAGTGRLEQLPLEAADVRTPVMTPEGARYLFMGNARKESGLWQAGMRSRTPELLLAAGVAQPRDLAMSRDGKAISFSQVLGDSAIWTMPLRPDGAAAGEPKVIVSDRSLRNYNPAFSADGSRITWASIRQGGESAVMTAKPDGSDATPLTSVDQSASLPGWFGNDLTVMYLGQDRGPSYWLQTPGGPPRKLDLRMDLKSAERLRASRDGTRIAAHTVKARKAQVIVEDFATHNVRPITPADRSIGFPCFSPDGKWIGAEEMTPGRSSLVYFAAGGGAITRIDTNTTQAFVFDWSPDSEKLLFAGLRDGVWNIFWAARSGGHVEQLTHFTAEAGFVRYPSWSPKGDQIVFERTDLTANVYTAKLQ